MESEEEFNDIHDLKEKLFQRIEQEEEKDEDIEDIQDQETLIEEPQKELNPGRWLRIVQRAKMLRFYVMGYRQTRYGKSLITSLMLMLTILEVVSVGSGCLCRF